MKELWDSYAQDLISQGFKVDRAMEIAFYTGAGSMLRRILDLLPPSESGALLTLNTVLTELEDIRDRSAF